ncbi:MAG: hypothetical protein K6F00_02030 [Lachnospiraceae bacterium]|nr:hypothetical protein [Lachnospiraceae bacterium]
MKNYESPIVLQNNDLAEGVFAASGSSKCWSIEVKKDQDDAGGYCTFRVIARHGNVQHISVKTVMHITFDKVVTSAEFEGFTADANGNEVILTRESHANAYGSGDNFNSLLKIHSPEYKTIQVVSSTIVCEKTANVQGKGADGN